MFTKEEMARIESQSAKLHAILDPIYDGWRTILSDKTLPEILDLAYTYIPEFYYEDFLNDWARCYPDDQQLDIKKRLTDYLMDWLVDTEIEEKDLLASLHSES